MTIVFFFPVILRDVHRNIYSMDLLEHEGNKIIILEATQYYGLYKPTATDSFIFERLISCKVKSDIIKFKDSLGESPVLYVTDNLYMKMAFEALNILVREQDKLLAASTRVTAANYTYPQGLTKFLHRSLRIADNCLPLHFLKFYYDWVKKIYTPDYYLGATKFLTANNTILSVAKNKRLYAHSDDVNKVFEPMENIINPSKRIGVFLDQMLPYFNGRNPDFDKNVNKEYKKVYYQNLKRTFEKLKKNLDLDDIVIALHPEAVNIRKEIDEKFAPFRTYIDSSTELIKDSSVVFGHFSTVIGLAVYYNKPIILFTDRNIEGRKERGKHISSYANELGLNILEIDAPTMIEKDKLLFKDKKLYEEYSKKFLQELTYQGNSFHYAINRIIEEIN